MPRGSAKVQKYYSLWFLAMDRLLKKEEREEFGEH